jgi:carboxypeptidase Taq
MRTEVLDLLFGELSAALPELVDAITERQERSELLVPAGPFPMEQQRALALELMAGLGFDFAHGRLDTSHHPFCGGVPDDVRLTTRYNEADFTESLMGVLHETGHAKYEQGLPVGLRDLPVGSARSMGVHESQSLFQEMQICRGYPFLSFAAAAIQRAFPERAAAQPAAFTPENLERLYTRVQRSLIRVDADEVTYPIHVILRYQIERSLIEGKHGVRDIPELWDGSMQRMLNLSTQNDFRNGCMQDVHWPAGAVGYFPSYTLGALLAAQLYEAASTTIPGLSEQLARGEFATLNAFLRDRIWSVGSQLETPELIESATGCPLGTAAFLRHVRRRYL